jgi:predicted DsbA family dithiol-disulfide isomerase
VPLSNYLHGASAEAMHEQLKRFAARFGVEGLVVPERVAKTRRALAMAEHAREKGRLEPFRTSAMEATWRRGADVEDRDVLAELAEAAGLQVDAALEAADHPRYLRRVEALRQEADEAGVTGIPTFFFGDGPPVVGCQPYEVLARAAEAAVQDAGVPVRAAP